MKGFFTEKAAEQVIKSESDGVAVPEKNADKQEYKKVFDELDKLLEETEKSPERKTDPIEDRDVHTEVKNSLYNELIGKIDELLNACGETDGKEYADNPASSDSASEQKDESDSQEETAGDETSLDNDESDEPKEKKGGSYYDVKKTSDGATSEVHHMPSDSSSPLDRNDGPAIKMDKEDHRKTASCGSSREAREYQEKQKELISQGKFREALQMDIDDIHEKFGDKYDDAINEMLEYVDQLEAEGKI